MSTFQVSSMKEILKLRGRISQRNRTHASEPPPPPQCQEVHLLKQKETPDKPTQVWAVPTAPASLVEKKKGVHPALFPHGFGG